MHHPQVEIHRWLTRYTPEAFRASVLADIAETVRHSTGSLPQAHDMADLERRYTHNFRTPDDIFSPRDLAITEHRRAAAGGPQALGSAVPPTSSSPPSASPPLATSPVSAASPTAPPHSRGPPLLPRPTSRPPPR